MKRKKMRLLGEAAASKALLVLLDPLARLDPLNNNKSTMNIETVHV
jgi:hypothetical protein